MKPSAVNRVWTESWLMVFGEMSTLEVRALISPAGHNVRLSAYRATAIVSRVRLLCGLFAILGPIWILIDSLAFGTRHAMEVAPIRLLSAVAFGAVLFISKRMHVMRDAYQALGLFIFVSCALFFYTGLHSAGIAHGDQREAITSGSAFLPLLIVAAMSLFPLTLVEGVTFTLPVVAIQAALPLLAQGSIDPASTAASIGILGFLTLVALLAGIAQLALMIVLARESIHDPLTRCFSRRAGEEMLDLMFTVAARGTEAFTLAYISLDRLPEINQRFGYQVGNQALVDASELLSDQLRTGDAIVRWSGTDFVLIMPRATAPLATEAMHRLLSGGLGVCPDKSPVTASIGIAERSLDQAPDWWQLIDLASDRAAKARASGGNSTIAPASA